MKVVLQRVSHASVDVEEKTVGKIGKGLMLLVCAEREDSEKVCEYLSRKIVNMRIFPDDDYKMNLSLKDIDGEILCISQFTLAASWKKGNRPGFSNAASPDEGNRLYEYFCECLKKENIKVEKGVFGAKMAVSLLNDGPVTIIMDSNA